MIEWIDDEPQTLGEPGVVSSTLGLAFTVAIIAGAVALGIWFYDKKVA